MSDFDRYKKRISTLKEYNGLHHVSLNSTVTINGMVQKSAQIVDDSDTKDQKAISIVDHVLKNGDIIDWQSEKWINIVTDNMSGLYYRGVLRRCNGSLKWNDEHGILNERYFTFKSDPSTNFGVSDGRIIAVGNERRTLLVSCDDRTRLFKRDQRFLFDSRAWKITAIDNISVKNISIVTLEEDLIDTAKDNLELEIADYVAPIVPPVKPEDPSSLIIEINGDASITKARSKTYTCIFSKGGSQVEGIATFAITDIDGNSTSLATIESQGDNVCIVKGVNLGYILLHAINSDQTLTSQKKIQIKALF
ncbi:hypothetical protein [Paenibacillus sp. FSL H3-0333]|uniref:hypothetical protein n=1 Tax=Paenibacillus sp. FSL H3-0333 TaxID=2921373 RepID=UPI0030FBDCA6